VVEEGTHDELMELGGLYHSLVTTQLSRAEVEEKTSPPPEDHEDDDVVVLGPPESIKEPIRQTPF
jgi:hypothetical protein